MPTVSLDRAEPRCSYAPTEVPSVYRAWPPSGRAPDLRAGDRQRGVLGGANVKTVGSAGGAPLTFWVTVMGCRCRARVIVAVTARLRGRGCVRNVGS